MARLRCIVADALVRLNAALGHVAGRIDPRPPDVGPALSAGLCPVCRRPMPWAAGKPGQPND